MCRQVSSGTRARFLANLPKAVTAMVGDYAPRIRMA